MNALVPVALATLLSPALAQVPASEQKLVSNDVALQDELGFEVAVDGASAVVGAPHPFTNPDPGNAYVFARSGLVWSQQAKLVANDAANGDLFGWSVDISADSAIVGARGDDDSGSNSGSAYVFVRTGSTWSQQAKLVANDAFGGDLFGYSAEIDGDACIIGARNDDDAGGNSGSAYVFTRLAVAWSQHFKLTASDAAGGDIFGSDVGMSGDTVVVGAPGADAAGTDSGAAYVFVRAGSVWIQQAKLVPADLAGGDQLGLSVAIDGDTLCLGAQTEGATNTNTGAAYVYERSGTTWTETAKLVASDGAFADEFGVDVAIFADRIVVGCAQDDDACLADVDCDSGTAYVFDRVGGIGGVWGEAAKIRASDESSGDQLGASVALDGTDLVCGARFVASQGAAYAFRLVTDPFLSACFGNGGDGMGCTDCPCSNNAPPSTRGGCMHAGMFNVPRSCTLDASGLPSVAADTLRFELHGGSSHSFAILTSGVDLLPVGGACPSGSGDVSPMFDGLMCVGGSVLKHGARATDLSGRSRGGWGPPDGPVGGILANGGFAAGQTRYFAAVYRSDVTGSCVNGRNTSNAVIVSFVN